MQNNDIPLGIRMVGDKIISIDILRPEQSIDKNLVMRKITDEDGNKITLLDVNKNTRVP